MAPTTSLSLSISLSLSALFLPVFHFSSSKPLPHIKSKPPTKLQLSQNPLPSSLSLSLSLSLSRSTDSSSPTEQAPGPPFLSLKMPAWWGRKSSKTKPQQLKQQQTQPGSPQKLDSTTPSIKSDTRKSTSAATKSFDEVVFSNSRNSPRSSREFGAIGGSSCGFSGFGSDGSPLPLPRPSISPTPSLGPDHLLHAAGSGLGSGYASVSSVSSSGSSDDHPLVQDYALFGAYRGNGETKVNSRSRSPGPVSRGVTGAMSPLHSRLSASNIDSPTGRQDEAKSLCHPLPLPPGSPTSPSAIGPSRTSSGLTENGGHVPSKWKKGRLLGRGTFGHVYLGFNSESGQMCAIKEVRLISDDHSSKECLKQLNQEISLLSQLSHPNIVQYYGSELGEESLSVFLEYVSGGSIHKLLQEYGAFKEPVIQNYTRQILSGLGYLHGRNTVHRDIKGANILVDPNGEIKLADFGMAKHITACASMLSFKGSPYWMAPEVVMNTNGYSLAVDIWSLGCTILEMATSKPPWSQYEGVAAIFKIGNSKDIPEIPEYLSNDAKSFLTLCLQRDPVARPTALQLLDHPFIRDQVMPGVSNNIITREPLPFSFDGCRTQQALEPQSNRSTISSSDRDYMTKPVAISRTLRSPRENARTITSLPVSPCSSPLRQSGQAYKSCFLSPPHPTYAMMGQNNYALNDYTMFPTRQNPKYSLDPWREVPLRKAQTPSGSPRR